MISRISDAEATIAGEHRTATGFLRGKTAILFDATSAGIHLRTPSSGIRRFHAGGNCGDDQTANQKSNAHATTCLSSATIRSRWVWWSASGWTYLAPGAGFEPATNRLTAGCSTTELPGNSRCYGMRPITKPDRFAKHRIRAVSNRKNGGHGRNRTGVHGFAVRCVTTPPRGPGTAI